MEVSARVAWAGVGVSLKTDTPSVRQIADAVAEVLGSARFRDGARDLAAVYGRYGGASRAAEVVLETASAGRVASRETVLSR